MANTLEEATDLLGFHLTGQSEDHGIKHALAVLANAEKALEHHKGKLTPDEILCVKMAALLHDADDKKLFKPGQFQARRIAFVALRHWKAGLVSYILIPLIEQMINLVAASENKEIFDGPEWMLIPRNADRLEAIGLIGIDRAYQYTIHKNRPLFTSDTPRVKNEEELAKIATPERFRAYVGGSATFIDHFYDKLVHICTLETTNEWLLQESATRRKVLVDFLFYFGNTGVIDEIAIRRRNNLAF